MECMDVARENSQRRTPGKGSFTARQSGSESENFLWCFFRVATAQGKQAKQGIYYRPQRSCGKVMFSQACVKNSVQRGWGACMAGGMHRRGGVWQGVGVCMAGETAIAAGGMHPTGMHSWFLLFPDMENTGNFILVAVWPPCSLIFFAIRLVWIDPNLQNYIALNNSIDRSAIYVNFHSVTLEKIFVYARSHFCRIKTYEHERRWDKALSSYDMLMSHDPLSASTQTGKKRLKCCFFLNRKVKIDSDTPLSHYFLELIL